MKRKAKKPVSKKQKTQKILESKNLELDPNQPKKFTVTAAKLKKLGACTKKLRVFKRKFPRGLRFTGEFHHDSDLAREVQEAGLPPRWNVHAAERGFPFTGEIVEFGDTWTYLNGALHSFNGSPSLITKRFVAWHRHGLEIGVSSFYEHYERYVKAKFNHEEMLDGTQEAPA